MKIQYPTLHWHRGTFVELLTRRRAALCGNAICKGHFYFRKKSRFFCWFFNMKTGLKSRIVINFGWFQKESLKIIVMAARSSRAEILDRYKCRVRDAVAKHLRLVRQRQCWLNNLAFAASLNFLLCKISNIITFALMTQLSQQEVKYCRHLIFYRGFSATKWIKKKIEHLEVTNFAINFDFVWLRLLRVRQTRLSTKTKEFLFFKSGHVCWLSSGWMSTTPSITEKGKWKRDRKTR